MICDHLSVGLNLQYLSPMLISKYLPPKLFSGALTASALLTLGLTTLCLSTNAQAAPGTNAPKVCAPNATSAWELDWQDDFAKAGAPDSSKWQVQIGGDYGSGDEAEFYTDSLKNMRVENHQLVITALKEDFKDKHYTSARMVSKQGWQYGRFEFRAKLPIGAGTWPAIWMLPDEPRYGGGEDWWLNNGEIDILEAAGRDPNVNLASAHTQKFNFMTGTQDTTAITVSNGQNEFHIYALEWYPDHLDFFLDGNRYLTYTRDEAAGWRQWPFDQKFHYVVNLAVGGGFGGQIDESALPSQFQVDYIRVYHSVDCTKP
jgi:beta-glucanase (GH16 family)